MKNQKYTMCPICSNKTEFQIEKHPYGDTKCLKCNYKASHEYFIYTEDEKTEDEETIDISSNIKPIKVNDNMKFQLVDQILFDDVAEYIAKDLKDSYNEFKEELRKSQNDEFFIPFFSDDKEENEKELKKFLKAFKKTYSYYSMRDIDEI